MTSDLPMNATSTQFCIRDAPFETAQTGSVRDSDGPRSSDKCEQVRTEAIQNLGS